MDAKQEKDLKKEMHEYLMQLALELEASADAAKKAAEQVYDADRGRSWALVQQMYTRLSQADHLLERIKATVDDAIKLEESGPK
jgi:hypothetical protein